MDKFWIIGCGDIGHRVAHRIKDLYQNKPIETSVIVASEKSANTCQSLGLTTKQHNLDDDKPLCSEDFSGSYIFYFAPPAKMGLQDSRLANFLTQVGKAPRRIVLISTTGVYGHCNGEWIDEHTPLNPQTARAKRRVSSELLLQAWAEKHHREYIILRVPGIYARNRLPLARLVSKRPIVRQSEAAFTNRIHADDLAEICIKAMQSTLSAEVFNATDGTPSTMVDYFNQVADYANLPRPTQITLKEAETQLSKEMLSYALESRRISNKKLLNHLNITLKYPTIADTLKC